MLFCRAFSIPLKHKARLFFSLIRLTWLFRRAGSLNIKDLPDILSRSIRDVIGVKLFGRSIYYLSQQKIDAVNFPPMTSYESPCNYTISALETSAGFSSDVIG